MKTVELVIIAANGIVTFWELVRLLVEYHKSVTAKDTNTAQNKGFSEIESLNSRKYIK